VSCATALAWKGQRRSADDLALAGLRLGPDVAVDEAHAVVVAHGRDRALAGDDVARPGQLGEAGAELPSQLGPRRADGGGRALLVELLREALRDAGVVRGIAPLHPRRRVLALAWLTGTLDDQVAVPIGFVCDALGLGCRRARCRRAGARHAVIVRVARRTAGKGQVESVRAAERARWQRSADRSSGGGRARSDARAAADRARRARRAQPYQDNRVTGEANGARAGGIRVHDASRT